MLCGWLMSATINGLMLPVSSEPRTNPSIWVTVGSTGKHKHVCTGTHLSSYCLSLLRSLSLGLSQSCSFSQFHPLHFFLSVSQQHPCCTRSVSTFNKHKNNNEYLRHALLTSAIGVKFTTRTGCAFLQRAFFFLSLWWMWWQCEGPSVWSPAREPASPQHLHTWNLQPYIIQSSSLNQWHAKNAKHVANVLKSRTCMMHAIRQTRQRPKKKAQYFPWCLVIYPIEIKTTIKSNLFSHDLL